MRSALSATALGALLLAGACGGASAQIRPSPSGAAKLEATPLPSREGIRFDKPAGGGNESQPAPADNALVTGITLTDLLAMAKQAGVANAEIVDSRDKTFKHVVGTSDGTLFYVVAFECDKGPCEAVQWIASFGKQEGVDLKFMTTFNEKYMPKMEKGDDGSLMMSYTMKMYGGVTRSHVQRMTGVFVRSIKTAIDFRPS